MTRSHTYTFPRSLRYIISVVPIIWIFSRINLQEMIRTLLGTPWWTVPFLAVFVITGMVLQGVKWWVLLKAQAPGIRLLKVMSCHFAGLFYSIILPSSTAQDFVRAFILSKQTTYSISWGSTWVSRILGLFVLMLFSVIGMWSVKQSVLPRPFLIGIFSSYLSLALIIFLSFSKKATRPIRIVIEKHLPPRLLSILANIRESVYQYRNDLKTLGWALLISIIMQMTLILGSTVLIAAITGRFLLAECFFFLPIIEIACISIPLTPNGVGLREFLTALMFKHIGFTREELGVYIILNLFAVSFKLVGGIPVLMELLSRKCLAQEKQHR